MTDFDLESADRLRRAIGDLVRAIQQVENTPAGQLETLGFLVRDGAQSIAQLARRRRIRHQSMSSTVVELETRGLVIRSSDPRDGRGVLVQATQAGTAMVEESRLSRSSAIHTAAGRVLTADERDTLARTAGILDKIRAELTPS